MKMASASVVAGAESGDAIFVLSSVIRGHHIYKTVWSPSTGEILVSLIIHMTTTPCVYGKRKWSLAKYLDASVEYSLFPKSWFENYVWTCDVNACALGMRSA